MAAPARALYRTTLAASSIISPRHAPSLVRLCTLARGISDIATSAVPPHLAAPTPPPPPAHASPAPKPNNGGFVARTSFTTAGSITPSFFLGHHKAGLDRMKESVGSVSLVIECRDYRVPLASRNPLFESTLLGKERVVVYTKRDLGMLVLDDKTRDIMTRWHHPHTVFFSDTTSRGDIQTIVSYCQGVARENDSLTGLRILIVGMPNVGKSTLLNALRRAGTGNATKAAKTGGQPGITRKLSNTVKISGEEDGLIYVIDTPGVFVPYMPNPQTMLKLALVGSVKDSLVPLITLADYLLFQINRADPKLYKQWCAPTNDVLVWLRAVAKKTGKLLKGGEADVEAAAIWMLGRYRKGLLGRFILDDVKEGALEEWIQGEGKVEESETAARRRIRKEKSEARRKKGAGALGGAVE